ncbi:hypothetical protein BC830DRAFT_1080613 [Chytriomyces sp. MP71]|nr:hypothetical protein BC830DRAFT_1080613 [Chytriomyces sp. MP71]
MLAVTPGDVLTLQVLAAVAVTAASVLAVRAMLDDGKSRRHPLLQAVLQRLPMALLAVLVAVMVFAPAHAPVIFCLSLLSLNAEFVNIGFRLAIGLFSVWRGVVAHSRTDWKRKWRAECGVKDYGQFAIKYDQVSHVIVIPNYQEDLASLKDTLAVLASHSMAKTNYRVCLAMEAAEKGSDEKARILLDAFKGRFADLVFTVHTLLSGEIRGKSSNVNHAVRELANMRGERSREIVTVVDADTCFAADYFECISYHTAISDPVSRKSQLFFAPVVFDRNTHGVSTVIRITDIAWSTAVMSMSMPGYPLRLALSTYSIPMDLAIAIGFWDTTPEAMGEDYHTSLKCYFATRGRVRTVPVFSPSSQCHIDGGTFWSSFYDRWVQMKRHAWAILDFSYGVRMAVANEVEVVPESYFEAWHEDPTTGVCENLYKGKNVSGAVTLAFLYFHLYETFIFPVHIMFSSILVVLCVPAASPALLQPLVRFLWCLVGGALLNGVPVVDPLIPATLQLVDYARTTVLVPLVCLFFFFEQFHEWCANGRWNVAKRGEEVVARLGKRSVLVAGSRRWSYVLDWFLYLGVPVFMGIALVWAMWRQLFTDQLVYVVAAKPVMNVTILPADQKGSRVQAQEE